MFFSSFLEKSRIILLFDELRSINHLDDSWFFSKGSGLKNHFVILFVFCYVLFIHILNQIQFQCVSYYCQKGEPLLFLVFRAFFKTILSKTNFILVFCLHYRLLFALTNMEVGYITEHSKHLGGCARSRCSSV